MKRIRDAFLAVTVLVGAAALPSVALAASQAVTIQDFSFAPASVTVNVGDSVTWRNAGGEAHTATSNNPGFDTGVLNPGASKTIVFGTAGTFDYHCAIHVSMRGTVTVLAAVATTPPPTPPPTVPPTVPPTSAPTAAPTAAPTVASTAAPTSVATTAPVAVAASTVPPTSTVATVAPSLTAGSPPAIAAASPSAASTATAPPLPAPANDAGPLPVVIGAVVLAGIAGLALYGFRRR